jgi:Carboxypeptidase regulatory-like domain
MKTQRLLGLVVAVVALLIIVACGTSGGAPSAPPGTGLSITAVAGPTCPVERVPPDPACAPRPVAGATIIVIDAQGATVTTVVTDAAGTATVAVPAGEYVVQARPVTGLMGTPEAQTVTVVGGAMSPVDLGYDTGIR